MAIPIMQISISMLLPYIAKHMSTNLLSWVYEFTKNELSNRNELIDFDKDDAEKNLLWFEYRDFEITLRSYLCSIEDVSLWSVSQGLENLFEFKTTNFCGTTEAKHAAKKWVDNYIQERRELFEANYLLGEIENNGFLYWYYDFKILCLVSPLIKNSVYLSIYDNKNNRVMDSWPRYPTVIEAREIGYRWIHQKHSTNRYTVRPFK